MGDPPLHVSSAAMSELSPIASGQILHLKWTLQVDSSPQKELYSLSYSLPSYVLMYIFPGFPNPLYLKIVNSSSFTLKLSIKSWDFVNSVEPPQTKVSKYLHNLLTLSSVLDNCLIALISQGLPTNANGWFKSNASWNLSKGEAGPYLEQLLAFNKSSLL